MAIKLSLNSHKLCALIELIEAVCNLVVMVAGYYAQIVYSNAK